MDVSDSRSGSSVNTCINIDLLIALVLVLRGDVRLFHRVYYTEIALIFLTNPTFPLIIYSSAHLEHLDGVYLLILPIGGES